MHYCRSPTSCKEECLVHKMPFGIFRIVWHVYGTVDEGVSHEHESGPELSENAVNRKAQLYKISRAACEQHIKFSRMDSLMFTALFFRLDNSRHNESSHYTGVLLEFVPRCSLPIDLCS